MPPWLELEAVDTATTEPSDPTVNGLHTGTSITPWQKVVSTASKEHTSPQDSAHKSPTCLGPLGADAWSPCATDCLSSPKETTVGGLTWLSQCMSEPASRDRPRERSLCSRNSACEKRSGTCAVQHGPCATEYSARAAEYSASAAEHSPVQQNAAPVQQNAAPMQQNAAPLQ